MYDDDLARIGIEGLLKSSGGEGRFVFSIVAGQREDRDCRVPGAVWVWGAAIMVMRNLSCG